MGVIWDEISEQTLEGISDNENENAGKDAVETLKPEPTSARTLV